MKLAGWTLIVIAVAIILINVSATNNNEKLFKEHPIKSGIFGDGIIRAYSFTPPYDAFEIFIIGMGIGGVVLVMIGSKQE